MTTRVLKAVVPAPAAEVIDHLTDGRTFPAHAEDILSVSGTCDGHQAWVIAFRGGTARWTQRTERTGDGAEQTPHRIGFEQVSGDFRHLDGSWTATDVPGGSEIVFKVGYSTSVPHLAGAIDSAVGVVLVRSAHRLLSAVAGGEVRVTAGGHWLGDPSEYVRQP
ncbi:type II toxin-antitoxin system RatA family toxin [Streptomyces sp. NPDC004126]|uniref:type II toxin-antitoxin system RatA family toxin n=1 Tax=Streptomyces sp. NPDC004126 TaxID=3390695 RepID=UPI003D020785